jgi:hypothetical protein
MENQNRESEFRISEELENWRIGELENSEWTIRMENGMEDGESDAGDTTLIDYLWP